MAEDDDLTWVVRQRFEFIEWRAYWTGEVSRKDLEDEFKISAAQASQDLRTYQERKPGNIVYDPSLKTHLLNAQDFQSEYLRLSPERFLLQMEAIASEAIKTSDTWFKAIPPVEVVPRIARWPYAHVLRQLLRAIENKSSLRINYQSLKSTKERTICPHAFGYDGYRWHVRAWAVQKEEFRDFVLGRIRSIGPGESCSIDPVDDLEWNTPITLRLIPHPGLEPAQKETIEQDYHIEKGELTIKMPIAIAFYFVKRYNFDLQDQIPAQRMQLFLNNYDEYETTRAVAKQMSRARATARKVAP